MASCKGSEVVHFSQRLDPFLKQSIQNVQGCLKIMESITHTELKIQCTVPKEVVTVVIYVSKIRHGTHISEAKPREKRYNIHTKKEALTLFECISLFNHKLRGVVFNELQLRKSLKDKASTLDRKITKLTELHSSVNEFSVLIDKILAFYSGKDMGFEVDGLPSADELNNAKRKLSELKKSLKHKELHDLFSQYNSDFITNQTSILCAIVGIDESYGEWIFKMDKDMKMHQTELYYLESAIEERADELEDSEESTDHGKEVLKKNLQNLGFTAERSKIIVNNIPDELVDLQSPLYWALRYLRYAFQHHPLLAEHSRYIYEPEKTDCWFDQKIPREVDPTNEDDAVETKTYFKMINVKNNNCGTIWVNKLLKEEGDSQTSRLFYHGTTHQNAKSIIEKGINLTKGSDCQDFSSGEGFYVSEKFENAKKWGRAAQGEHQAVIVYKIKRKQWDAANGLDLMSSKKQWEAVITLCRNGYKNKALKKELLRDVDYVRGSICRNPMQVAKNSELVGFCIDDDIQVCIRGEYFAEEFGSLSNILCVIFY